jgi:hypothetical protein
MMSLESKSKEFIDHAWPEGLPPTVIELAKATFCAGAVAAMEMVMAQSEKVVPLKDINVNFVLEALMMVPKNVIASHLEKRAGGEQ